MSAQMWSKEPWQCRICDEAKHVSEYHGEDAPGGLCWNCLTLALDGIPKPEGIPALIRALAVFLANPQNSTSSRTREAWEGCGFALPSLALGQSEEDVLRACGIEP